MMQWLTLVWGRAAQDHIFWKDQAYWSGEFRRHAESGTAFRKLDHQFGNPSEIFQEWVSHPQRDEYWDSCNPTTEQYRALNIPILTITGIYDSDQLGALTHYREHVKHASPSARAKHYLVIGPWDHAGTRTPALKFGGLEAGPESLVDLQALHAQWYAWTMQSGPKPEFLLNQVAYYVMGADRWRYADTLESVTARVQPLYLSSTQGTADVGRPGALAPTPPVRSSPDRYIYDPRDVSLAELESTVDPWDHCDQRMLHAAPSGQLVYDSEPLDDDTEISGFFKLSVWLAIDQPDTDFCVTIYDLWPDGHAIRLTCDWMRARYRKSSHQQTLIDTSNSLLYDFDGFTFVSRQMARGHRVRLVVGPLRSVYAQKNFNSGGVVSDETMSDALVVTVSLHHDAAHPSVLHVPIGRPRVQDLS
jgi:putative CocE/NonD family hydrolase